MPPGEALTSYGELSAHPTAHQAVRVPGHACCDGETRGTERSAARAALPSPAHPTSIEALTVMPNAGMAGALISAPPCCVRMDASTLRMACCSADGADADAAGGRAGCLAQLRDEVGGRGGDQAGCGGRNIGSGSHSPVAVVDDDGAALGRSPAAVARRTAVSALRVSSSVGGETVITTLPSWFTRSRSLCPRRTSQSRFNCLTGRFKTVCAGGPVHADEDVVAQPSPGGLSVCCHDSRIRERKHPGEEALGNAGSHRRSRAGTTRRS